MQPLAVAHAHERYRAGKMILRRRGELSCTTMNAPPPVTCRVCGTENRPTRLFCSNCGNYLQAEGEDTWEELPPRSAAAPVASSGAPPAGSGPAPRPTADGWPVRESWEVPVASIAGESPGGSRSRLVGVALLLLLLAVAAAIGALVYATLFSGDGSDDLSGVSTSTTSGASGTSTSTTTGANPGSTTSSAVPGTTLARGQSLSPTSVEASSVLPSENGITYEPGNLFDDLLETAWQEGADGGGEGEWVQFDFDREITLSAMEIANGYQKDSSRFSDNPRVETLRVEYSDGTTQQVRLYDDTGFQEIALASKPTEWLRLTILSIYPGDQWDDAGFSEVRLFQAG